MGHSPLVQIPLHWIAQVSPVFRRLSLLLDEVTLSVTGDMAFLSQFVSPFAVALAKKRPMPTGAMLESGVAELG